MSEVYYEDNDIRVWTENINDQAFIHVGIFNMTKNVLGKIKEKWGELIISLYFEGYENVYTYTKDNRIIKLIGGAEYIDTAGEYEVWKWDLS